MSPYSRNYLCLNSLQLRMRWECPSQVPGKAVVFSQP